MAELKVYLSETLSERFRRTAMVIYGYGRGSLSKAAEDALAKWCEQHEASPPSQAKTDTSDAAPTLVRGESHIDPDERTGAGQKANTGSPTSA